jgi:hypothetical protein
LADTAQCKDFAELKQRMSKCAEQVSALYRDLISNPARHLRALSTQKDAQDDS